MAPKFEHRHILLVSLGSQGQINPARRLGRRLVRATGAAVTLATPISAYRRIFLGNICSERHSNDEVSYASFSDGYDEGFHPSTQDGYHFMSRLKTAGSISLSRLTSSLAGQGRCVTCIISTILFPWVANVAQEIGVPCLLLWTQSASVFAAYYHYFNGYNELIDSHREEPMFNIKLPGLPLLKIKELPSILTTVNPYLCALKEAFEVLQHQLECKGTKPRVLVNTFDALESDAILAIDKVDLISIGPLFCELSGKDLFVEDPCNYMDWLDTKDEKSVVYVSFGSISMFSREQMNEIYKALEESQRPYLWVLRNAENIDKEHFKSTNGLIVSWCSQTLVLGHCAIGAFLTHCGWNSTMEAIAYGVPMIMAPQWTDQLSNAAMAMKEWKVGVEGEMNDGVLGAMELKRCLNLVMGEEKQGVEIRNNVAMWRERVREIIDEQELSDQNLKLVIEELETVRQ